MWWVGECACLCMYTMSDTNYNYYCRRNSICHFRTVTSGFFTSIIYLVFITRTLGVSFNHIETRTKFVLQFDFLMFVKENNHHTITV